MNSFLISINGEYLPILDLTFEQDNTTVDIYFSLGRDVPRATVVLEIKNNTIYDMDQYGPLERFFTFHKNIYSDASYQLATSFPAVY